MTQNEAKTYLYLTDTVLSKYHDFLLVLKHKNVPFQLQNGDTIEEGLPIQGNE